MAVLKRGDNAERWRLSASRRFAASFALAMKVWVRHFGVFFRLMWLPCLLSVGIGVAWIVLRPRSVVFGSNWGCLAVDFFAGAAMLFVWSMMRTMQLKALAALEADGTFVHGGFVRNFATIAMRTWRPYVPLVTAWLFLFALWWAPILLKVNIYIHLACIAIALVVPLSVGGMLQSYMEAEETPLLRGMMKGIKLNRHYWGGMAALWVIALLIFALVAAVLSFGLIIIIYAIDNREAAVMQEEELNVPYHVGWLTLCVFAAVIWLLSFLQSVWSLPQQMHIKSIIYKTLNK